MLPPGRDRLSANPAMCRDESRHGTHECVRHVAPDDEVCRLDGHVAIERDPPAGLHHLHQRLAIAHSVAADRFDLPGLLQDVAYGFRAAGHAAGAESDPDFDRAGLHAV